MAYGCPVVVLPGFGDQVINARKAVDLGVGLKVDRPTSKEQDADAACRYRENVCQAVQTVLSTSSFKLAARCQQEELRTAGGVPYAVDLVLAAAREKPLYALQSQLNAVIGGA